MGEAKRKRDYRLTIAETAFAHTMACAVMALHDKLELTPEQIEIFTEETREQFQSVIGRYIDFDDAVSFVENELGHKVMIDLGKLSAKKGESN